MSGQRLAVESAGAVPLDDMLRSGVRTRPDVAALASRDKNRLCVLVWHYYDDDLPGADAAVELTLMGLSPDVHQARCNEFRIDDRHSNAFTMWKSMGSPLQPTAEQFTQLEKTGQLAEVGSPKNLSITNGLTVLKLGLPRQSVSLLVVSWDARP
jgi:xylan 1,4-beta-xylosidase